MTSNLKIKRLVAIAVLFGATNVSSADNSPILETVTPSESQCKLQVKDRWKVGGVRLAEGDVITAVVGGFNVSYEVNSNATAADQWPLYLAMKFNEVIPADLARMGSVKVPYSPVQSVDQNMIDVFVSDIPVSIHITRSGSDVSYQGLKAQKLPTITYSNEMLIPNVHMSDGRALNIYMTNRETEDLDVRVLVFDHEGKPFSIEDTKYLNPPFSDTNDPMKGIATLNARATTRLAFGRLRPIDPTLEVQMLIKWTSDTCLFEPMIVTSESVWAYDGEILADGRRNGAANGVSRQDYGPF